MTKVGVVAPRTGRRSLLPGRISSLLLSLSMLFGTLGFLANPAATLAWDANGFSSTSESQLLSLTNQARAAAGLPALKVDSYLASLARWRSEDMITKNYFSHSIPPTGYKVWDVLIQKGYCFQLAAENIAWNNYADDTATAQVQSQFMNSSTHRANILNARFDLVGIGAYKGADGKKMWTVIFVDKCGSTTPTPTATPKPTTKTTPKPTTTSAPTTPTAAPTAAPTEAATATPAPTEEPDAIAKLKTYSNFPAATPEPAADVPAAPVKEKGFFDMIGDAISGVISSIEGMIHGLIG